MKARLQLALYHLPLVLRLVLALLALAALALGAGAPDVWGTGGGG